MQQMQRKLGRSRDAIKGIAILWVVFFHAVLDLRGPVYDLQKVGYGGVDIFFFLSGFGLYYSLSKNADLSAFLRRRLARLLPAYLPFCILWLCIMIPLYGFGVTDAVRTAVSNLSMMAFWCKAPAQINWYTSALLASYLLAPVLFAIMHGSRSPLRTGLLLAASSFLIGLGWIDHYAYMAVSRLPVFILGMVVCTPEMSKIGKKTTAVLVAFGLLGGAALLAVAFRYFTTMRVSHALAWHPFILFAPALCMTLAWAFDRAGKVGWLVKPFAFLGNCSFEIFLFNVWFEVLGKTFGLGGTPKRWAALSLASIVLGIGYHYAVAFVQQRFCGRQKQNG